MSNTTTQPTVSGRRPAGFRFSVIDAVAIAVALVATVLLRPSQGQLAFLFPIVLFHFFLFCNVFRVHRNYELIWAGCFIINFAAWSVVDSFTWPHVLLTQTPITVTLLVAELRSPRYHGIGYARINPRHQQTNRPPSPAGSASADGFPS